MRTAMVWMCGLLAIAVLVGPAFAGQRAEGEAPKPKLTPEQIHGQQLLERWKAQMVVKRQEEHHRAQQHLRLGTDQFDMGDYRHALKNFEDAVKLDPNLKEAQEYLRKTRSMLNITDRRTGDWARVYAQHRSIAVQVQKTELANLFAAAKAHFDREEYTQAIEAFTRVKARAQYLSPRMEVGRMAEEAEAYIQRALQAIDERQKQADKKRLEAAKEASQRLRDRQKGIIAERHQALLAQARTLYEQTRFEDARKVCEQILREDPTHGAAETLRESSVDAARSRDIDTVLKKRKVEMDRHWQTTRAMCVPQPDLVYISRDRFEEVRQRSAAGVIGGTLKEPPAWEKRIRQVMGKTVSFDFVETPLQDVITFLSTLVDVTIVLDREALGGDPATVTLKVNDMRLEAALNWVLKLVGLKYTLKNEAIFISRPEKIYDEPVLRMYDVTDLTIDIKNFQGRQQALASDGGYSSTGAGGGGSGGDNIGEDFFGTDDEREEEDRLTGESLVDFIRRTIAPGTWAGAEDEFGAPAGGGARRKRDQF